MANDIQSAIKLLRDAGYEVSNDSPYPTVPKARMTYIRGQLNRGEIKERDAYAHLLWCLGYIDHLLDEGAWAQGG